MNSFMFLMFAGTLFTALSQTLLKISAQKTWRHPIYEYLNWRVILAYGIFFGVLLLNTYAYTGVDLKYGTVIDAFAYVWILILSRVVLKEKISAGKIAGNLLIIAGILIYTL